MIRWWRLSCDNLKSVAGYSVSDRRKQIVFDAAICVFFLLGLIVALVGGKDQTHLAALINAAGLLISCFKLTFTLMGKI